MSQFYNPQKTRNLFEPNLPTPYRLSRTGIDLFIECPRCFYLEKRLGVSRPPGFPFSLNAAVDSLLKKEFDLNRAEGTSHPLMKTYGIDAVPFKDERLEEWRDSRTRGIQYLHEETNFLISGGIDDVWVNSQGELHVVDYKATAKNGEVSLDAEWQAGYKRQMEIYQWLFRKNGFKVSNTGYFVYCNAAMDKKAFDGKLEFNVKIIPYEGNDAWVEDAIMLAHKCLLDGVLPAPGDNCDYCAYRESVRKFEK